MNNQDRNIEIHEFSTGIKPDRDSEGNWISRGFTGRYMNCTLSEIPYNVERAIANKLFAVVEGYTTEQPAVIGRIVPGITNSPNKEGELDWSVVAIVSRGRDEKGRPLSVYRYFLSQGFSLQIIVDWVEQFQRQNNKLPVFNPSDEKSLNDFYLFEPSPPSKITSIDNIKGWLEKQNVPIVVVQRETITLSELHYRAAYKAANIRQSNSISWAYNIEALEAPGNFIVISAASETARLRIENSLNNISDNPRLMFSPATFDLQMIKSAIKSLIGGSISSKAVEPIFSAIQNGQEVTEEVWQKLFDGEGASRAIRQSIYSPQMLRLLTLRAMTISRTLPEFLDWLSADYIKKNKEEFLEFSRVLKSQLNYNQRQYLQSSLFEGVREVFLRNKVSNSSPEFFDNLIVLLTDTNSLWNICLGRVIGRVAQDLKLITQTRPGMNSEGFYYSEKLWREIIRNWNQLELGKNFPNQEDRKKYLRFAKLFAQLSKYSVIGKFRKKASKIAAYFYQISRGEVPNKLFSNAFGSNKLEEYFLAIPIQRKLNFDEKVIHFIIKVSKLIAILVIKPVELIVKFIFYIGKSIVDFVEHSIQIIFRFIRKSQILEIFLISISMVLISITIIISYPLIKPPNPVVVASEKENFNNSINMLNILLNNLRNKSLSETEKFSLVINEMSLNEFKNNCLIKDQQNEQIQILRFMKHDDIGEDCREELVNNFLAYEENIVTNTKNNQKKADGQIEEETIDYLSSKISGILEPEQERYKKITVPILKELVQQVENKINEMEKSLEEQQLDKSIIDRWFLTILKQFIIPKDYSGNPLQYSILKQLREIDNITQEYDKFIQEKKQNLQDKNSEYLKEWAERFFVYCIKSEKYQISSINNDEQNVLSANSCIKSDLVSAVATKTTQHLDTYLDTIKLTRKLAQDFTNKNKSLESVKASFENTRNNIKAIEIQSYQDLLNKLNISKNGKLAPKQEEDIKKAIHNTVKEIISTDPNSELVDIDKINLDKVKSIKLDKLEKTINLDNLDDFKNQLQWIKAIYDYQSRSGLTTDGIISNNNKETGAKFKSELIKNEELINKIKVITQETI